jgi:anti-sigma regulatory factor (Ser/Thr protein kinase)
MPPAPAGRRPFGEGETVTVSSEHLPYPDRAREVTSLTLAATLPAVSRARQFTRFALSPWGLGALAEDAELVASELVTNAVQASGAADPLDSRGDAPGPPATVRVRVLAYQAGVVVEVWDRAPGSPARRDAATGGESGRGLVIVAALSRDWGFSRTADGDKVVWAELAVPAELLTPARLPRRARGQAAGAGPAAGLIRDPALLRRVLQGLLNL